MTLRALHVASECAPLAKTGGLGDVVSALPRALARLGASCQVVIPRHRLIDPARWSLARHLEPLDVQLGRRTERVIVLEGTLPGGRVPVYLLEHPLFDRAGLYGEGGSDYPDNGLRFALLARGALALAHRMNSWPDIVHAHDWQAGLAPVYAKRGAVPGRPAPATMMTIHNLAFLGLQPKALVEELDLGWDLFSPEAAEFYDHLSFLKAGLSCADLITTVSPKYAREIQAPEHGAGLDGFLRARADKLVGILNGIDVEAWDPEHDPNLPARFSAADRSGKATCKASLQRELGLPIRARVPLIGAISRLTEQKGFDLIAQAGDDLARLDAQLVVLGEGEPRFEEALRKLARRYPMKVAVSVGHDEGLAHRIEAGADFFLMPSRFEPCGLGQLHAFRYGTVPIVRATGGLDDTVVDYDEPTRTGTGFKFEEHAPAALLACLRRALRVYGRRDAFDALAAQIMRLDHSWGARAQRYLELYRQLAGASAARGLVA